MEDFYNKFEKLENARYNDNKIYNYYNANFLQINPDKKLWKLIIKNIIDFDIKERCLNNLSFRIKKWLERFEKNSINEYSKIIINKYIFVKICKTKNNSCNVCFFILQK